MYIPGKKFFTRHHEPVDQCQEVVMAYIRNHSTTLIIPFLSMWLALVVSSILGGYVYTHLRNFFHNKVSIYVIIMLCLFSVIVCIFFVPWMRWHTNQTIITDQRIILRTGLCVRKEIVIPYHKLDSIECYQNFFERMLHMGRLDLRLYSGEIIRCRKIPQVKSIHRLVMQYL